MCEQEDEGVGEEYTKNTLRSLYTPSDLTRCGHRTTYSRRLDIWATSRRTVVLSVILGVPET